MKYISVYVNGVFYEESDDYTFDNRTGIFVFTNKFNAYEKVTITVAYIDNVLGNIDNTYEDVYERVKYYDNFSKLTTSSYEPPVPVTPPRVYLYNNGDECVSVTGGWDILSGSNCVVTKETDHLLWTPSSGTVQSRYITTNNPISFSGKPLAVYLDFEDYVTISNVSYFILELTEVKGSSSNKIKIGATANGIGGTHFKNQRFTNSNTYEDSVEYDQGWDIHSLEDISGNYYLNINHYSDYSQTGYAKIYAIWLE